jgi:KipI family sensor histidine kinase inhibitor
VRLVGSNALLLEVDDVAAWTAELSRRRGREFTAEEIVPGARTVLVDGVADPAALAALIEGWQPEPPPVPASDGRLVEIPTIYDGPDLADVAVLWDSTIDDVIAVHRSTEFRVAFFGFAPGFAYLTGLPRTVPRRDTPRTRVPAGSVGLADAYSAIYPSASPGGWQLIGHTAEVLFDVDRQPPARLAPGDRVRFTSA